VQQQTCVGSGSALTHGRSIAPISRTVARTSATKQGRDEGVSKRKRRGDQGRVNWWGMYVGNGLYPACPRPGSAALGIGVAKLLANVAKSRLEATTSWNERTMCSRCCLRAVSRSCAASRACRAAMSDSALGSWVLCSTTAAVVDVAGRTGAGRTMRDLASATASSSWSLRRLGVVERAGGGDGGACRSR